MLVFGQIPSAIEREAYQWYRGFSLCEQNVASRQWNLYQKVLEDGWGWCATTEDEDDFVALGYLKPDEFDPASWELGGLMLARTHRNRGVGICLARLMVASFLVSESDPSEKPINIHAFVLEDNTKAQNFMVNSLGFKETYKFSVDKKDAPENLPSKNGKVEGRRYDIVFPDTPTHIADWLQQFKFIVGKSPNMEDVMLDDYDQRDIDTWIQMLRAM